MPENNTNWTCYQPPEFNAVTGQWEINLTDSNGEILETKEYVSKDEADDMFRETIKQAMTTEDRKDKKKKKETEKDQIKREESVLEKKLREMNNPPSAQQSGQASSPGPQQATPNGNKKIITASEALGLSLNEDAEELLQKFKEDYDAKKKECSIKAKNVLKSVAEFYLGANLFNKTESVKYKVEVEEMGFAATMMQLDIAQQAMFRLSMYINAGAYNSRLWEVMGTLQKTILETVKYQHEYMNDMEESMKRTREDIISGQTGEIEGMEDLINKDDANAASSSRHSQKKIPDRKEIIDAMNQQLEEIQVYMKIPSRNLKLATDVDDITFTEIPNEERDTNSDDITADDKRGLGTFDEDEELEEQNQSSTDDEEE